ncbi:MAG: hypothetical protein ACMXYG_05920 [Candidatus Woesearchaeota archaeon]
MVDNQLDIKLFSISLIILIVLIPINISITLAGFSQTWEPGSGVGSVVGNYSLRVRSISGNDGIENYRRRTDSITIVVQASLGPNVTVNPNNLEVFFSGFAIGQFNSCTQVSEQQSIYECTFTEGNITDTVAASVQNYEIRLVNVTQILASTSKTVTVDNRAPTIVSLQNSASRTANPNQTVSFSVNDYAHGFVPGVGIRSLRLTVGGNTFYQYPEGENTSLNYYDYDVIQNFITRTVQNVEIGPDSGNYEICLYADDFFGQADTKCINVVYDADAPLILGGTFNLTDTNGNPAEWLSDEPLQLVAEIGFQDVDINPNSIYGNFSDLNIDGRQDNVRPSRCTPGNDNILSCEFSLTAKINATRQYSFVFYVEDDLGNGADLTVGYSLKHDNIAPKATSLTTPYYYNGNYFIGANPTNLTVAIQEEGIGVNNSNIFFGLSNIGLPGSVKADNCTGGWTCYWYDISAANAPVESLPWLTSTQMVNETERTYNLRAKQAEVMILSSSEDDLGNSGNFTRFNLSVDIFPPEIIFENITTIPASAEFLNYTVVGDTIQIYINVTDGSFVSMNVRGSDFIPELNDTIDCIDNLDGIHTCLYYLGPIQNEGFYDGTVYIELTDLVGNSVRTSETIRVYQIENGTTNYWSGEAVGCNPDPLDRHLVERMPSDIYCQVNLKSGSAIIYDLSAGSCVDKGKSGEYADNSSTLRSYNWMGVPRNEPNLFLNIVTSTFNPRIDELEYECTMGVRSIVNDQIITQFYEEVNVTVGLELFNNPLGEVDQAAYDKLNSIYKKWVKDDFWNLIGKLDSFVTLSTELCKLYDSVIKIGRLFESLGLILGGIADGLKAGTFTIVAGQGVDVSSGSAQTFGQMVNEMAKFELWPVVEKYCAFVTCKVALSPKFLRPVQEFLEVYMQWSHTLGLFEYYASHMPYTQYEIPVIYSNLDTLPYRLLDEYDAVIQRGGNPAEIAAARQNYQEEITRRSEIDNYKQRLENLQDSKGYDQASLFGEYGWRSSGYAWPWVGTNKHNRHQTAMNIYGVQSKDDQIKRNKERENRMFSAVTDYVTTPSIDGIKESYILSTAFLCVPGIIYNLNKYREIECEYGNCLLTSSQSALPASLCSKNKAYMKCRFFYGPLVQFIPFARFLADIQKFIANLFTDVTLLIDVGVSLFCNTKLGVRLVCAGTPANCGGLTNAVGVCLFYDTVNLALDVYEDVKQILDDDWSDKFKFDGTGACNTFEDSFKKLGKTKIEPENTS